MQVVTWYLVSLCWGICSSNVSFNFLIYFVSSSQFSLDTGWKCCATSLNYTYVGEILISLVFWFLFFSDRLRLWQKYSYPLSIFGFTNNKYKTINYIKVCVPTLNYFPVFISILYHHRKQPCSLLPLSGSKDLQSN